MGEYAMKRVVAGAHFPSSWLFEPASHPDDRADYSIAWATVSHPRCAFLELSRLERAFKPRLGAAVVRSRTMSIPTELGHLAMLALAIDISAKGNSHLARARFEHAGPPCPEPVALHWLGIQND